MHKKKGEQKEKEIFNTSLNYKTAIPKLTLFILGLPWTVNIRDCKCTGI